jgi:hypothetical protein
VDSDFRGHRGGSARGVRGDWLHEGVSGFGRDPNNEIVLPDGPSRGGTFQLHGGRITVLAGSFSRELVPDSSDSVKAGRLSLLAIQRGDKFGIRLKDPESPYRLSFRGIDYYPAHPEYRVIARFGPSPLQSPS